jgi:tol-pal system protein YbgF
MYGFIAMIKRNIFIVALLMSASFSPVRADDMSNRVDQLQQQLQQLVGQVEELNYTVKQLQGQIAVAPKQTGAVEEPQVLPLKKKIALAPVAAPVQKITGKAAGIETIEQTQIQQEAAPGEAAPGEVAVGDTIYGTDGDPASGAAPTAQILGSMDNKAAKAGDGGFQGKLIVPPDGSEQAVIADGANVAVAQVENASVQPETPDDLFLRSEQSLLHLQYSEAENGFKDFLTKYPDHNLAGNAQFKLGETYYAQQQYEDAAKSYLTGYKSFPKSRRAPDSMLKLGLAMNRMGQSQQGCAVLGSVGDEFPNAVEVKKRAQSEYKRAGC